MDHHNPETYSFDDYLSALGANWYEEDSLLRKWTSRIETPAFDYERILSRFGDLAANEFRKNAEFVERKENLPYIEARDPYNRRAADVIIPDVTRRMLAKIHGSGMWKKDFDPRARYAICYLLNLNGEHGVTCSTACTDGMNIALRKLGTGDFNRGVIEKLETATEDNWIHGAQFVTEIQGGSDAATNAVEAIPARGEAYELSGQKWFCSNCTADYFLVTARWNQTDLSHRGVGLFCVPRYVDGKLNGFTIDRLKDKLGTRALPTGEITFNGAVGFLVGEKSEGLKNMVQIVLTASRMHNVIAAAASARRSHREAKAYAEFRHAFGKSLAQYPIIRRTIEKLDRAADRMSAGAFAIIDEFVTSQAKDVTREKALWARIIIMLAKAMASREIPGLVYEAMMTFGGNGIEERFCAMPRLWRDAAICETWEGPYSLLLSQSLGDLAKYGVAGREAEFLKFGLGEAYEEGFAKNLGEILANPQADESMFAFETFARDVYTAYEERALAELV
ncbi:MAG: acyl-CoA dehydrogenase family protein [Planctomycetes bacterium]|nr:acyl-CoA dehydrogenase family protein [Planctomycetota bacterium]